MTMFLSPEIYTQVGVWLETAENISCYFGVNTGFLVSSVFCTVPADKSEQLV